MTSPTPASVPDGLRVYAIGDVHGCAGLLDHISRRIRADMEAAPPGDAICVLLGDYIDRGPDSAGVLSFIAGRGLPVPFVALRGNHEQMLLDVLDDAAHLEAWRYCGGLETLHSFGIRVTDVIAGRGFDDARSALQSALGPRLHELLLATRTSYEAGGYFFCHAGIRPGVPLAAQQADDLLWIREAFIASTADHGKVVVHGHTPVEKPDVRPNRINIDTGAYLSGQLTCLVLEGEDRRFIFS